MDNFLNTLFELQCLSGRFVRDVVMKASNANIMNAMQRCVLTLYTYDSNPEDISAGNVLRQCLELIAKVPSQLHTPLMSGTNAISGITVVGAISITAAAVKIGGKVGAVLGFLAIVFATINVIGGYMVTDRMLGMFKKKDDSKAGK